MINSEIAEITHKIEALDSIRASLQEKLLKLQEEELELDDECMCRIASCENMALSAFSMTVVGVKERVKFEESIRPSKPSNRPTPLPSSSRRRKGAPCQLVYLTPVLICYLTGPAFLPSEHDDLPPGIAFMVLE